MLQILRPLSLLCVCASALAQSDQAAFDRPLLGFVWDKSLRAIRPMSGTPGAALVTAPVSSGLDNVIVSGSLPIAVAAAEGLRVIRSLNVDASTVPVEGGLKRFDLGAFSPSSKSAIIAGTRTAQVLSDLSEAPRVVRTIDLAGDVIEAVAVNDDASAFAISTQSRGVVLYSADEEIVLPLTASGLAFSPDGKSLAIVDATRKTVTVYSTELAEIAAERDGLRKPLAVSFASNGRIIVADAEAGAIVIDRAAGRIAAVECPCLPSVVERTASGDVLRLTGLDNGAVWLLQLGESDARTMFVPVEAVQ